MRITLEFSSQHRQVQFFPLAKVLDPDSSHPFDFLCLLCHANLARTNLVRVKADYVLSFFDLLEHCNLRTNLIETLLQLSRKLGILLRFFLYCALKTRLEFVRFGLKSRQVFCRRWVTSEPLLQPREHVLGLADRDLTHTFN